MDQFIRWINFPTDLSPLDTVKAVVQVVIISVFLYYLFLFLRRTRALPILRGMFVFVIFAVAAELLKLDTITFILRGLGALLLVALPIVFQPELRRALEQVGQRGFWQRRFGGLEKEDIIKLIHTLVVTLEDLAIVKMGALVVMEQETPLDEYTRSGTALDSVLTSELLKTVFFPHTFLHDGAILLRGNRVMAAGCFLPLSENPMLPQDVGSRHRAALGISEVSDAISLVVSEETGKISLAHNGKLIQDIKPDALRELLYSICFPQSTTFSTFIGGRIEKPDTE